MSVKRVEFASAFPLAKSVDRLKATTRPRRFSFSAMAHESAVGRVSAQRVVLQRVTPMFRNSFKPFFIGRFVEREGRVSLVGRFRMLWLVRIFMTFWLGAALVLPLSIAISSRTSPREREHELLMGAIMFTAGVAVVAVCKWLSRNDPAWLSSVIRNALSAETSEPVVAARGRFARTQVIGAVCLVLALVCWVPLVVPGMPVHRMGSSSALARIMTAINGAVLLFIAYGAFRRQLFAWRLGLVFLALIWLESVLPMQWERSLSGMPLAGRVIFLVGSMLVTAIWGGWWYTQRVHWEAADERGGFL